MTETKIDFNRIEAVVFDMDGVITQTAKVHARAWKKLFDRYLQWRNDKYKEHNESFDIEKDYSKYVDGIPRYDGVKNFLSSRNIELEYGDPSDPPGKETICGLGNQKNQFFNDKLKTDGVDVYEDSVEFIKFLRSRNIQTAVVSSSKNCSAVLEAAGIKDLFDAQVDGTDISQHGLKGKPAPDIFIEACKRLGVQTEKAAVLEDAILGVTAAGKSNFLYVVGVDRIGHPEHLKNKGADVVVSDIRSLYKNSSSEPSAKGKEIPSALNEFSQIMQGVNGQTPAVFLDYDGTLTPIVEKPEDAVLSDDMRRVISELAKYCTVGIISGRDLQDVRSKVRLEQILFAGSHGFDVHGPQGEKFTLQKGKEFLPELDEAEKKLKQQLASIENSQVERKKFSIAVHFRRVEQKKISQVETAVDRVHSQYKNLKKNKGKKVLELQPNIDWDKGKALLWLMKELGMDLSSTLPFYIGDDVTDEDAFKVLQTRGISILVSQKAQKSYAKYILKNPDEVKEFLENLLSFLKGQIQ
ncbi:trehalose-phosphatase [bacterium]|nr:trehalose-phosphatase [bacterium]